MRKYSVRSTFNSTRLSCLLVGLLLAMSGSVFAEEAATSAVPATSTMEKSVPESSPVLRFAIDRFVVEGSSLLTQADFDKVVAPFVGKEKDFADVQHALEAVEEFYAERGYSAVRVLLPEQELEAGTVRFQVIESRFGKVVVKENRFVSAANVLSALPSVRSGGVPSAKNTARELKLANENPARQLNVVLKAGEKDDLVDASVLVADSEPGMWTTTFDNSGSIETGRTRLGISYRHANLFDADHVGQIQMQISPQHTDRVKVFGGNYKAPLYQYGHSVDLFAGYSNINSLVGGLSNFQGGGLMFGTRYNVPLERWGTFDPRVTFGFDWRKFSRIELTNPPPTTLYNEIVVTPLSLAYSSQGKLGHGDANYNASYTLNIPMTGKGKSADFADYDQVNHSSPTPRYKVLRYGAGYFTAFKNDWQFRVSFSGQHSSDILIQGEQMRLGGADGVRGFSEGSETGEKGARLNIEGYLPAFEAGDGKLRALVFWDSGMVKSQGGSSSTTINAAGIGFRSAYTRHYSLRLDAGRIMKAGNDPQQLKGDWRLHASLQATF
ncbi:MAG: ShlB/FhaC/HecB family hemolysin secretion/activation protein [Nitrosomonadales bacterium]|nr:ShlB/FhaC/HecB family hemolysin secretion/activation protein [Nitrosomonadales bacterium]